MAIRMLKQHLVVFQFLWPVSLPIWTKLQSVGKHQSTKILLSKFQSQHLAEEKSAPRDRSFLLHWRESSKGLCNASISSADCSTASRGLSVEPPSKMFQNCRFRWEIPKQRLSNVRISYSGSREPPKCKSFLHPRFTVLLKPSSMPL